MVGILAVIAVFGIIVAIHEWGHMLAAKLCGVGVPDFALGMGPSLLSFQRGETRYHLCAVPIGGFVRIAGLEGDGSIEEASTRKRRNAKSAAEVTLADGSTEHGIVELAEQSAGALTLDDTAGRPLHIDDLGRANVAGRKTWREINGWQKAFILTAGPLMNFILAFFTVFAMGAMGFPNTAVLINGVVPGGPADIAGLRPGDVVERLDGQRISTNNEFMARVMARKDQQIPLEIRRHDQQLTLSVTPTQIKGYNEGHVSLGVTISNLVDSTNEISLVSPKSLGDKLDLQVGDKVLALNGKPVTNGISVLLDLPTDDLEGGKALDAAGNVIDPATAAHYTMAVQRRGKELSFDLPGDTTALTLGIQFRPLLQRLPLGETVSRCLGDAQGYMLGMLYGIKMLFTKVGAQSISGPVGIVRIINQSANSNWYTFLQIFMLINLNLGLMNLLPLPALDGGRLLFVGLGGIGIRISEKREALVHAIGMFMLLGLIGIVTFTDVLALF